MDGLGFLGEVVIWRVRLERGAMVYEAGEESSNSPWT